MITFNSEKDLSSTLVSKFIVLKWFTENNSHKFLLITYLLKII